MPTYDYSCPDCEHKFQRFQSMSADPVKLCPQCNKENVKRLIGTGGGLIFKGSGFYITDYRSSSYSEGKKSEGGSGAGESSASGSGSSNSAGSTSAPSSAPSSPAPSSSPSAS